MQHDHRRRLAKGRQPTRASNNSSRVHDAPVRRRLVETATDDELRAVMLGPPGRVLRVVSSEAARRRARADLTSVPGRKSPSERKKRQPTVRPGGRHYYHSGSPQKVKYFTCRCAILEFEDGRVIVDQMYWPSNSRLRKKKGVGSRKSPSKPPGVRHVHLCTSSMVQDKDTSEYRTDGTYKLKDHLSITINEATYACHAIKSIEDQFVLNSKMKSDCIVLDTEVGSCMNTVTVATDFDTVPMTRTVTVIMTMSVNLTNHIIMTNTLTMLMIMAMAMSMYMAITMTITMTMTMTVVTTPLSLTMTTTMAIFIAKTVTNTDEHHHKHHHRPGWSRLALHETK